MVFQWCNSHTHTYVNSWDECLQRARDRSLNARSSGSYLIHQSDSWMRVPTLCTVLLFGMRSAVMGIRCFVTAYTLDSLLFLEVPLRRKFIYVFEWATCFEQETFFYFLFYQTCQSQQSKINIICILFQYQIIRIIPPNCLEIYKG